MLTMLLTHQAIKCYFLLYIMCFFALPFSSRACTCFPVPVCEALRSIENENEIAEGFIAARGLIVQTTIVNEHRRDILIQVLESFYNPKGLQWVRIRDGNSINCEFELDAYDIGDELIFITDRIRSGYEYSTLGHCYPGGPLEVAGDLVTGYITENKSETLTLDQFRNLDCIPATDFITLYPNPVANTLTLRTTALTQPSDVEVLVINPLGQRLYTSLLTEEDKDMKEYNIDIRHWPVGTYYLAVKGERFPPKLTPFVVMH